MSPRSADYDRQIEEGGKCHRKEAVVEEGGLFAIRRGGGRLYLKTKGGGFAGLQNTWPLSSDHARHEGRWSLPLIAYLTWSSAVSALFLYV
jgi:hypothetical protein